MDFLSKHVELKSPFGSASHFANTRQLQGWQPHFQPTVAKSSISIIIYWFAAVTYHNCMSTITALQQILETTTA